MPQFETPPDFASVLLGGGRSTRMGKNKGLLSVEGKPLWRRQYDLLASAFGPAPLVSLRLGEDWLEDMAVKRVFDDGSMGPLGGILAAWEKTEETHLAVLAVDLPGLPLAWWAELACRCGEGVGAIGQRTGGFFEPLAAIYPRAFFVIALAAAGRGEGSLQSLAAHAVVGGTLQTIAIGEQQASWFQNWNEPKDLPPELKGSLLDS